MSRPDPPKTQQKLGGPAQDGGRLRWDDAESFEIRDLARFEIDTEWNFRYLDPSFKNLTGHGIEDFLCGRKCLLDIVHEEDRQDVVEKFHSATDYYSAEFRIHGKEGTGWLLMRGPVRRDETGAPLGIRGVLSDVSRRRKARYEAQHGWEAFSCVADSIEDGLCVIDEDDVIRLMNRPLIKALGDRTGETYQQFLFKAGESFDVPLNPQVSWSSCYFRREARLLGSDKVFELRILPFFGPGGMRSRVCIFRDISRLKKLEHKFRNFVVEVRAVSKAAEMAELGIFILRDTQEREARILFANNAFCKLTGYSLEELTNMGIAEVIHPDNREVSIGRYRRRLQGEPMRDTYELQLLRKNQTTVTVFFMGALSIYYGHVATVGFVRDITFRKKLQESLFFSQKLAAIGKFSAELAHEINNPLTSVLAFNKLIEKILQQQPFPAHRLPEVLEYIRYIANEVSRCGDVARNLLDFTRSTEIRIEEQNIHKILDRALGIVAHWAQLSDIKIITSYALDVPPIRGDFNRLQQAFMNIFVNAVEAMPQGGILSVTTVFKVQEHCLRVCKAEKNTIEITISDTGVGIPHENLNKIFEPFFSTKAEKSGVGLGLSVAYGIVTKHNGTITVSTEPGNGTCFMIELPVAYCSTCSLLE